MNPTTQQFLLEATAKSHGFFLQIFILVVVLGFRHIYGRWPKPWLHHCAIPLLGVAIGLARVGIAFQDPGQPVAMSAALAFAGGALIGAMAYLLVTISVELVEALVSRLRRQRGNVRR